jgi:hypothetical protein
MPVVPDRLDELRPAGMADAACRGVAVDFVPTHQLARAAPPDDTRAVLEAACACCPVRQQCERFADETASVGWWAGRLRRGR